MFVKGHREIGKALISEGETGEFRSRPCEMFREQQNITCVAVHNGS